VGNYGFLWFVRTASDIFGAIASIRRSNGLHPILDGECQFHAVHYIDCALWHQWVRNGVSDHFIRYSRSHWSVIVQSMSCLSCNVSLPFLTERTLSEIPNKLFMITIVVSAIWIMFYILRAFNSRVKILWNLVSGKLVLRRANRKRTHSVGSISAWISGQRRSSGVTKPPVQ
jgi:hypothetical protein